MKFKDFRHLSALTTAEIRQAARNDYDPIKPDCFTALHPVYQDEWLRIDLERKQGIDVDLEALKGVCWEYLETEMSEEAFITYLVDFLPRFKTEGQCVAIATALKCLRIHNT